MVKFWNSDFSIGKSENSGVLETIAACDMNIGRCKQYDKSICIFKVKVIYMSKLKLVFLRDHLTF